MNASNVTEPNRRILIIDDNPAIHEDLRKILCAEMPLQDDEAFLFDAAPARVTEFEIDSAYQGQEGLEMVKRAIAEDRPYAMAIVDGRMPPGWDGVETIVQLRKTDPNLQTVICSAYSDHSWNDLSRVLGRSHNLLILKKPFDNIEIIQMAEALTEKWLVTREVEARMANLDRLVIRRTADLLSTHEQMMKEVEEKSKVEEAFRIIFEASPISISLLDQRHRFVDVNPGFEARHGIGAEKAIGRTPAELGLVQEEIVAELERQIDRDGTVSGKELVYTSAAGGGTALLWIRKVEIWGSPHYLVFSVDITQRKAMERELRMAWTAAEAGSRAKSEFLSKISHELRTPMNGILGFTQMVLDSTQLSADQRDSLETVESSAGRLMRIIEDILDFSRIETGCLDLSNQAFSLRECVELVAKPMNAKARQKALDLQWYIAPEIPDMVTGDAFRLRQVLLNLVGNAIKFTAKGWARVEVTGEQTGPAGMTVHFRVSDTGTGIPMEKQQVIFEPFMQADSSISRTHGGTGLGLAICARLVELMGGRIWVESKEGEGSTFHFTATLALVSPAEPEAQALEAV